MSHSFCSYSIKICMSIYNNCVCIKRAHSIQCMNICIFVSHFPNKSFVPLWNLCNYDSYSWRLLWHHSPVSFILVSRTKKARCCCCCCCCSKFYFNFISSSCLFTLPFDHSMFNLCWMHALCACIHLYIKPYFLPRHTIIVNGGRNSSSRNNIVILLAQILLWLNSKTFYAIYEIVSAH